MVASFPRSRRSLVAACAAIALGAGPAGATPPAAGGHHSTEPVSLDAASSDVDYKSNTVVFRDIVVTQGNMRVAAEEARATGLNFDDSQWTFSGNVRITVEGGSLASDKAIVRFLRNQIAKATITGDPASFEHELKGTTSTTAHGRAGSIEYDPNEGTVRLSKDAWVTDGRDEITGERLVYDIAGERMKAETVAGDNQRVRITIRPRDTAADDAARESKKP